MIELATRKNIAPYRGGRLGLLPAMPLIRGRAEGDRMMKVEPARLQPLVDGLEICRVIRDPDMLEHADRCDLVEIALDLRIVAQLDRHLALESEARDLFPRK